MKKESEPILEINSNEALEEAIAEAKKDTKGMPKPTSEEVEEAHEEYERAIKDWEKSTFELSPEPKTGQNFINYIKNYIKNKMMWTQNAWMGAIKLKEELDASDIKYNATKKKKNPPMVGYQALEFIGYILNNPGGIGIASAEAFEKEADQHVAVLEHLENQLIEARKSLDHIKWLQDKWAAYEQGMYIEKEPTDDEMPEGSYFDKDKDRFLKPGDKGYDIQKFIEAVKEEYGEDKAKEVGKLMEKNMKLSSVGPDLEQPEEKETKK